jgi:predicted O-methyltransferase YrrM
VEIVAYVLSCPAREAVRKQTLANLAATDWGADAVVEIDRTTHVRLQERQTETALRLLERAVRDAAEFMLFLEDDLDFNRFLRHNLEHWYPIERVPRGGHFFASLYNPRVRALESGDGLPFFIADRECVYGSQAFVLSAATARHIVDNWEGHIGMQDIKMSRLASAVSPIYYHRPSLVQHVGVESAWGGRYHSALDFQRDWKTADGVRLSPQTTLWEMRRVEGWLDDAEARLLIELVTRMASAGQACSIVEVGSYCGKSTVVFASTLKQLDLPDSRVSAVGTFDGRITALDGSIASTGSTLEKFRANIASAGVASFVEPVVTHSDDWSWNLPVDFAFIDGLHDYEHVAADFDRVSARLRPGGVLAFHDCAPHFPGVQRFVQELVQTGGYTLSARANSLVVLTRAAC